MFLLFNFIKVHRFILEIFINCNLIYVSKNLVLRISFFNGFINLKDKIMNKNIMYKVSILLILWILNGCKSQEKSLIQDDHLIKVQLVQLNDVYEIAPLEGGKSGGMARVATIVDSLKQLNPNTLLFLAGDFLNPSLIGTMKLNGERIRGKQMIEVMNAMNFDLVAFGNHEFDLKYTDLQKRLNESDFDWILGNAKLYNNQMATSFFKEKEGRKILIPQTKMIHLKDADGTEVSLGFFSEIVASNPKDYVCYINPFEEAKADFQSLKQQGADIILGLTHLIKEDDLKILEMLPEVPLIMGGHEHYNMLLTASNGHKVAKADANARSIYLHNLMYNTQTGQVNIVSHLIYINEQIADQPDIQKIVDKWQNVLLNKVQTVVKDPNKVILHTEIPLDAREKSIRHRQTNFGQLITDAMLAASKNNAVAAIVNGGSIRIDDQLSGDIVAMDFFRALPFGGGIYDIQIKGDLLKKVLDYGENHQGKGSYLQRSKNIEKTHNGWKINNQPVNSDTYYNIMVTDYLMKGYDIPFLKEGIPEVNLIDKPVDESDKRSDIRKVIIDFLLQK